MLLALFYLQLCKVVVAQIGNLFGCMRINDFGIGRRKITRQQKEKRVEERYKTKGTRNDGIRRRRAGSRVTLLESPITIHGIIY